MENLTQREIEIAAAKETLRKYGYVVDNLWSTDDAINLMEEAGLEITEEQAYQIVKESSGCEYIIQQINEDIKDRLTNTFPMYAAYVDQEDADYEDEEESEGMVVHDKGEYSFKLEMNEDETTIFEKTPDSVEPVLSVGDFQSKNLLLDVIGLYNSGFNHNEMNAFLTVDKRCTEEEHTKIMYALYGR